MGSRGPTVFVASRSLRSRSRLSECPRWMRLWLWTLDTTSASSPQRRPLSDSHPGLTYNISKSIQDLLDAAKVDCRLVRGTKALLRDNVRRCSINAEAGTISLRPRLTSGQSLRPSRPWLCSQRSSTPASSLGLKPPIDVLALVVRSADDRQSASHSKLQMMRLDAVLRPTSTSYKLCSIGGAQVRSGTVNIDWAGPVNAGQTSLPFRLATAVRSVEREIDASDKKPPFVRPGIVACREGFALARVRGLELSDSTAAGSFFSLVLK
ncbi:hypothetical protein GTR04_4425 [Trichophyton interdigitale]|nr:hypothetical protein GTR04_4425 [Trichophyton interdigitale]